MVSTGKGGVFGTLAQPYGYSGDHEGSALAREQEDSDEGFFSPFFVLFFFLYFLH